jgi:putative transposase
VNRDGIHFDGLTFIAPELNGHVGERVQVRYMPHDLRRIEVFRGDDWWCTAYPQYRLSEEERAAVLARRRQDAAELSRRQRRASRRARLAPITGPITDPGALDDITVVTADTARAEQRRRKRETGVRDYEQRDRDLQRTDLLNLHRDFDYWNPPQPEPAPMAAAPAIDLDHKHDPDLDAGTPAPDPTEDQR